MVELADTMEEKNTDEWVNRKKTMSICPKNVIRSKCPSIKRTRTLRRELLMKQRDSGVSEEVLDKLRADLKAKKSRGIKVDCKNCPQNKS